MKAQQASHTARLIARCQYLASCDDELKVLVPEGTRAFCKSCLTSGDRWDWAVGVSRFSSMRSLLFGLERWFLPGIIAHYLARKMQIELWVNEAIKQGCERLVVIGAGFDSLCWRLHQEHEGIDFIELDHPATQAAKKQCAPGRENLKFFALDLNEKLPSSVLERSAGKTIFVMEGLTMYLHESRVMELFTDLRSLGNEHSGMIFTMMEKDAQGGIQFRGEHPAVRRWLQLRSEPFLWGATRSEVVDKLKRSGFHLARYATELDLRRSVLLPADLGHKSLAEGEVICFAEMPPSS